MEYNVFLKVQAKQKMKRKQAEGLCMHSLFFTRLIMHYSVQDLHLTSNGYLLVFYKTWGALAQQ